MFERGGCKFGLHGISHGNQERGATVKSIIMCKVVMIQSPDNRQGFEHGCFLIDDRPSAPSNKLTVTGLGILAVIFSTASYKFERYKPPCGHFSARRRRAAIPGVMNRS
ncbi:hypothetical protein DT065_11465 [Salicibibacter kimchii]|uniref:Uncharacterized protein n=1 Tax=Salicibibacter kimchii TaxID=2099786 RepID=A0A345C047_9BACI|nr:hypothetical protein DT065_11465 [Salicibibacter kimchii]